MLTPIDKGLSSLVDDRAKYEMQIALLETAAKSFEMIQVFIFVCCCRDAVCVCVRRCILLHSSVFQDHYNILMQWSHKTASLMFAIAFF